MKCRLLRQTLVRGKENCRSLAYARDDKKEGVAVGEGRLLKERVVAVTRRCTFLVVSNILCKRRFVVLALGYSAAAVEAVRMWEAFFALHICIA